MLRNLIRRYLAPRWLTKRNRLGYNNSGAPLMPEVHASAGVTLGATTLAGVSFTLAPVDGPFNAYLPSTSAHWTALGLPVPDFQWNFAASSGDIPAAIGSQVLTTEGTGHLYQQTVPGWNAKACGFADGSDGSFYSTDASMDIALNEPFAELLYYGITGTTAGRPICVIGSSSWQLESVGDTAVRFKTPLTTLNLGVEAPAGYTVDKNFIRPVLFGRTASTVNVNGVEANVGSGSVTLTAVTGDHGVGGLGGTSEALRVLLWARWRGANATTMLGLGDFTALGWPEFWPF